MGMMKRKLEGQLKIHKLMEEYNIGLAELTEDWTEIIDFRQKDKELKERYKNN